QLQREHLQDPEYREHVYQLTREYKQTERGKRAVIVSAHRRRVRVKGAEGHHNSDDIEVQYRSQKGKCWHCGKKLNRQFEVDHLMPLAKSETNWQNNIVYSCKK